MDRKIDVGCYYFPNYHPNDARNAAVHGSGWSEWELVKAARPRFPGHRQPLKPLWGYTDESRPEVMARKIDAAWSHGIDYFIFDYYHYNDGTFLSGCLDRGFLPAAAESPLKFALMWANHDWLDIHPCGRASRPLLYPGKVDQDGFRRMCRHVTEHYFKHPSYYTINGMPYFSIYHLELLIESCGGFAGTREALQWFREEARRAGLPGVHLNAVIWGSPVLPGETELTEQEKVVQQLGFDSAASYVWIHHIDLPKAAQYPYWEAFQAYWRKWDEIERQYRIPYFPNVTAGWDPSPRTLMTDRWEPVGYPYTCTLSENTPENFRRALEATRDRLLKSEIRTFSVNCWNEWTEGSMLEPEARYGYGYLDALKAVFPRT
ncbi:glycosyltransferase WbsX family protein [Victivallis vadensis]|mgnify:FL=1|uniref:glycosyltransferase WbsX family protein n=1 Tax=Victivallis vadensis TaxID=172901 RepID=UPI0023F15FC7|nr:glycoside hydrolase family 99-like domain-containing protein [Victivallis vadensis]